MYNNSVTFNLNGNTVHDTIDNHSVNNLINNTSSTSSTSTYENNYILNNFGDDDLLDEILLTGILKHGWEKPTPIQEKVIPTLLDNRDVLAQAQSGKGKTGAFSISAIQKLLSIDDYNKKVLIISPTRELADQSCDIINELAQDCTRIKCNKFVGKVQLSTDRRNLEQGTNILSGTPGRILDLLERRYLKKEEIVLVIIDEADVILRENFIPQIKEIVGVLSKDVQIALFSATIPPEISKLAGNILNQETRIDYRMQNSELTLDGIKQFHILVDSDNYKRDCLDDFFTSATLGQCVIFCNSRDKVNELVRYMKDRDHTVDYIHADMTQEERDNAMKRFRKGTSLNLISTDLLARGIDVQQVGVVINFDMPTTKENYIHRIGRSGRYGRKGVSISFVMNNDEEKNYLKEIENYYETEICELPNELNNVFTGN